MDIKSRYSIGDVVWGVSRVRTVKKAPCPDCLGTHTWSARSPRGGDYTFNCPRCSTAYPPYAHLRLDYPQWEGLVQRFTVGSVRVDTNDEDNPITYMCQETGVGSGQIHREAYLFLTQEEAQAEADRQAYELNQEPPVKVPWDRALDLSTQQLESAELRGAREVRDRVRSILYGLEYMADRVKEAEDLETAQEEVDSFLRHDLPGDLEKLTSEPGDLSPEVLATIGRVRTRDDIVELVRPLVEPDRRE